MTTPTSKVLPELPLAAMPWHYDDKRAFCNKPFFNADQMREYALAAIAAASAVPPGLSMKPMEGDDGTKGWFIDGPDFYVDIDRNLGGQYEVFVRSKDGVEGFAEMTAPQPSGTAMQPLSDFDLRGILASELTCWHRLTGAEADNLLAFARAHGITKD